MKKSYVQFGLGVSLAIAVLMVSAFQEGPAYAPATAKDTNITKLYSKPQKSDIEEVDKVKKELELLKKDLSTLTIKSDEEIKARESNLRTLERESVGLKNEVKRLKQTLGILVNNLINNSTDSTLKSFDVQSFEVDTLKKKSETEVTVEPVKKRGLFKRIFRKE